MPAIRTAVELGLAVRSRRKELGLDQAGLARRIGVTRQWIIDIEKGKPRAELELVMRALQALDLSLSIESSTARRDDDASTPRDLGRPGIDSVFAHLAESRVGTAPTPLEQFRQSVNDRRLHGKRKDA